MALPRGKYVREGQEGVYHCFARCVRRAFLCGFDPVTQRDFSHRKAWLVDRIKHLSTIFAVEVCAYAIMWNHYHTILRIRPDIVAGWSDREVAIRWLKLFPRKHKNGRTSTSLTEANILAIVQCPKRIAVLRERLCSLSWFMGQLNEFIARAANKEDAVKGRFWESRFKCQALLDEAAVATCMVYVDLNPIRAGLAVTPEESDFTSIRERIRAWQIETMAVTKAPAEEIAGSLPRGEKECQASNTIPNGSFAANNSFHSAHWPNYWLCPISSDSQRRGILHISEAEYFDLVDKSGRAVRANKRGAIPAGLAPILQRIGVNSEAWLDTVCNFESKFGLASGLISSLREFAQQIGSKWVKGTAVARYAFASSPPGLA